MSTKSGYSALSLPKLMAEREEDTWQVEGLSVESDSEEEPEERPEEEADAAEEVARFWSTIRLFDTLGSGFRLFGPVP